MELYLVVCVFAFIEIVVVYHSRESVVGSEDSKAGSCVAASWYTRLSSMRKSEWSRAGGVPTLTIAEKQCAIRVQNLSRLHKPVSSLNTEDIHEPSGTERILSWRD
nr:hypothetical protein L203_03469 [Cryptococcus depauperatus CBS 7841]